MADIGRAKGPAKRAPAGMARKATCVTLARSRRGAFVWVAAVHIGWRNRDLVAAAVFRGTWRPKAALHRLLWVPSGAMAARSFGCFSCLLRSGRQTKGCLGVSHDFVSTSTSHLHGAPFRGGSQAGIAAWLRPSSGEARTPGCGSRTPQYGCLEAIFAVAETQQPLLLLASGPPAPGCCYRCGSLALGGLV